MDIFEKMEEKWTALCDKTRPFRQSVRKGTEKTGKAMHVLGGYLYRLRAAFMAVPVGVAAVWLAILNMSRLPQSVGIDLQANGEFSMLIPKEVAVFAPLAVTALCILLMMCSKKTVFPWLISIFTLVLPVLIYFTNIYPA